MLTNHTFNIKKLRIFYNISTSLTNIEIEHSWQKILKSYKKIGNDGLFLAANYLVVWEVPAILVEGNIGSGKTTFLNYFNRYENVSILAEPIELWRNCNGYNLLGLMYENPKKWSFTFQSYVQLTMLQHHCYRSSHSIKLMERSVYSAKYCFVEKMRRDNILSEASAAVIDEHFKWLINNSSTAVDLIVYLRTTPEVAYDRIIQRNRVEEKTISFDYLQELHDIHEEWLFYKNLHHCPAPVVVLNANLDKSVIEEEYQKCHPHIFSEFSIYVQA